MNLFSFLRSLTPVVALACAFGGAHARAITFHEVPKPCERLLRELPEDEVAAVVDWRPWIAHLRDLGYGERKIHELLEEHYWDLRYPAEFRNLTAWPSLRKVDLNALVEATLTDLLDRLAHPNRKQLKSFLQRTPFWLDPNDPQNVGTRMMAMVDDRDLTRTYLALEPRLAAAARGRLREAFLRRIDRSLKIRRFMVDQPLLHLLSIVPWTEIPKELRDHLSQRWVDLNKYPPLRLKQVQPGGFGLTDANNCKHMSSGHMHALGLAPSPFFKKPARLIRVGGHVVGSLKSTPFGEDSMLALRNVTDERGRLVLALGAVYQLPREVWERAGAEGIIELESLRAGPVDFLLNYFAWEAQNVPHLFALVMDREAAERAVAHIAATRESVASFMPWSEIRDERHEEIQAGLLRRLDQYRVEREAP